MAAAPSSLRQRKKDRTRATLIEVSQRLFQQQGYEATTLEQIATGAEVSVPTLLVSFETKDRLALAPDYDLLERFRQAIDDPARTDATLDIWRHSVAEGAALMMRSPKASALAANKLAGAEALVRGRLLLMQGYEQVLARGLAADFGTDPEADLATSLMATMLSFGNARALQQWLANEGAGDLAASATAVVDFAIERFPKPGL